MNKRLAGALALCLLAVLAATPADARTDDRSKPILYVHGYDSSGFTIGYSCTSYFDGTYTALESWGHTGERALVRYYRDDSNCNVDSHAHGSHGTHHPGGHSTGNGHTRDTSIRHLGYHLAWTVYDRYTSQGVTVDLIGHSMGGLIARYAIGEVARGNADFPPSLLVEDAVTVGTPHGGSGWAWFCGNTQCVEMRPGSSFLNYLSANSPNPGAPATDWTNIASDDDEVVAWDSATNMAAPHKSIYLTSENLSHSGMLDDNVSARDRDADYMQDNDGVWRFDSAHPRAVLRMDDALVLGTQ